jgi:subtilisin family serine protease
MINSIRVFILIGISFSIITSPFSSTASENILQRYGQFRAITDENKLSALRNNLVSFKPLTPNKKMSSGLYNLISPHFETLTDKAELDGMVPRVLNVDKTKVILRITGNVNVVSDAIIAYEGRILRERGNLIAIEIPKDKIEGLVSSIEEIEYARLPHKFFPLSVTSEGVDLTGAKDLHDAGYTGSGVKVAIIDIGFKGLSEAQANGDIPFNAVTYDFSGKGLETQYLHGTACAEIVHDMAPDAELHLLKMSDEIDFYDIIEYCVNNDIDIVSLSLGSFGSGPGNGTGPFNEACDEFKANGILVIASAGNQAESTTPEGLTLGPHWEGLFNDANSDNFHEFIPGGQDFNPIGAIPYQDDDGTPETDDVTIIMRWNDWPHANIDYDLFLFDAETAELVSYSNAIQDGSQPPLEGIIVDLPDDEDYVHQYLLVVTKEEGEPAGTEIEIYLGGTSMFIPIAPSVSATATSSSSITEPADGQSVLAVGAIDYTNWTTGPQEDFSSQGPTNAWAGSSARIKPDICGPDGVSGYAYGSSPSHGPFYGTSASAPHVAGAAALILSLNPDLSPDQLQSLIESNAIDMGDTGKDNIYGWGKIDLGFITGDSWKLISINKQPTNTNIEAVLDSIIDKVISVWAYAEGSWKVYDPENAGFSDLTAMEAGRGYWLHVIEPASLTVSGSVPSNSIELTSGWNLVGYNSDTSQSVSDALASIEEKCISLWAYMDGGWKVYDPANPGFSDLTTMEPGYGYWINAREACTWILP